MVKLGDHLGCGFTSEVRKMRWPTGKTDFLVGRALRNDRGHEGQLEPRNLLESMNLSMSAQGRDLGRKHAIEAFSADGRAHGFDVDGNAAGFVDVSFCGA